MIREIDTGGPAIFKDAGPRFSKRLEEGMHYAAGSQRHSSSKRF